VKLSKPNDWLGVITNLGLIAGLILVAYEIHQNNIALEREARISHVEVVDSIRAAWQNWEYAIIENRDVADIWMRGNAGESLDRLEAFRYEQLGREMFRLISQNYRQYSTIDGEPADWTIRQLIGSMRGKPRLKEIFMQQLERDGFTQNSFRRRIKELDPPELRRQNAEN
jgi:hypothetical protein